MIFFLLYDAAAAAAVACAVVVAAAMVRRWESRRGWWWRRRRLTNVLAVDDVEEHGVVGLLCGAKQRRRTWSGWWTRCLVVGVEAYCIDRGSALEDKTFCLFLKSA